MFSFAVLSCLIFYCLPRTLSKVNKVNMQLHFSVHLTPLLKLWQNATALMEVLNGWEKCSCILTFFALFNVFAFELSSGDNDKDDWKPFLLIVELVIYAPQSNAVLERFFSQLNYIKTNMCSSLSSSSLNFLLHVEVTALAIQEYHNEHVEKAVEFWQSAKNWHMQNKKKPKNISNKHISFDINTLSLSDSYDSCLRSTLGDK